MSNMETEEKSQMKRQHIFAVNGAIEFLDIIRELLQDEQYNVTTTNFVPNTFDQIAALEPDLLIIDLAVGVQAGWNLLEQLASQAQTRQIPVIVVSTSAQILEAAQTDPEQFGGHRFLRKPVDLSALVQAIDDLIGQP